MLLCLRCTDVVSNNQIASLLNESEGGTGTGQLIFSRCSSGLRFDKRNSVAPQHSQFLAGFLTAYKNHPLYGTNIFMNNGV